MQSPGHLCVHELQDAVGSVAVPAPEAALQVGGDPWLVLQSRKTHGGEGVGDSSSLIAAGIWLALFPAPPLCRELRGSTFASRHRGTAGVWGLQSAPLGTCSPCPWSSLALGSVGPRG